MAEHFEKMLNKGDYNQNCEEINATEENVSVPTLEEFEKYIKKQKSNKASGNDEIPAELLKYGEKQLHRTLHNLIYKI